MRPHGHTLTRGTEFTKDTCALKYLGAISRVPLYTCTVLWSTIRLFTYECGIPTLLVYNLRVSLAFFKNRIPIFQKAAVDILRQNSHVKSSSIEVPALGPRPDCKVTV
jgi:hypothetical protein